MRRWLAPAAVAVAGAAALAAAARVAVRRRQPGPPAASPAPPAADAGGAATRARATGAPRGPRAPMPGRGPAPAPATTHTTIPPHQTGTPRTILPGRGPEPAPAAPRVTTPPHQTGTPRGPRPPGPEPAPAAPRATTPGRDARAPRSLRSRLAGVAGSGFRAEAARVPAPASPHLAPGRGSVRVVAVVVALLALLAGGAALVATRSPSERASRAVAAAGERAAPGPGAGPTGTAAPAPPAAAVTPGDAFARAGERLRQAGSFSYAGSVSATDVSTVRPSRWLAVDVTVDGQVLTTIGGLHEVAVAGGGRATETVTRGTDVWGRSAASRAALADESYGLIPTLSGGHPAARGAALLPDWLAAATGPAAAGTDAAGRPTFRATIPATVLGPIERGRAAVDAEVVLSLDATGAPAHVEITSRPGAPRLRLAFDISGLGDPVTIDAPG